MHRAGGYRPEKGRGQRPHIQAEKGQLGTGRWWLRCCREGVRVRDGRVGWVRRGCGKVEVFLQDVEAWQQGVAQHVPTVAGKEVKGEEEGAHPRRQEIGTRGRRGSSEYCSSRPWEAQSRRRGRYCRSPGWDTAAGAGGHCGRPSATATQRAKCGHACATRGRMGAAAGQSVIETRMSLLQHSGLQIRSAGRGRLQGL